MMKRTLPLLLLLALACATGCEPKKDTPNANVNTSTNVGIRQENANVNSNANNTIAPALHTKEDKTVALIIGEDAAGKLQIFVAPEDIKLLKSKNQKLRFHVFNNTEVDLKEVVITFVTENPMDGNFTVGDIKAGNDKNSSTQKIKTGVADGKYVYGIKAIGNTSPDPVAVMNSPEVEIAT
ncbi:MAG TPA: hypothetical protein VF240_14765 [Pyrinomonadaceae bacterium]